MDQRSLASTQPLTSEKPGESFLSLLVESYGGNNTLVGTVIRGKVVALENEFAIIDVGLKSEGRVALREFTLAGEVPEIRIGDTVDVYLERMEDKNGEAVLSHEKARREAAWIQLEKAFHDSQRVNGIIFGKVKGGYTVDLDGVVAFLPGSQVDVRPIRDADVLMNIKQPFQILKMDRARGNIVVSRRAILEESRAEARNEIIATLEEGKVLDGVVKNITPYGAFVELKGKEGGHGGADGLLHVTDISWNRINDPSEVLHVGQTIKVQVIRFNAETQRISLGMKQLEADPWKGVEERYPIGSIHKGRVTNVTEFGAFVSLEEQGVRVEGLVHVSEMSWTKKNVHPSKFVSPGDDVEVKILDIDLEKRRLGLGMKQCQDNPWETLQAQFPLGSVVEGEIKKITEFGLFVGLTDQIDGMVHMGDISWDRPGEEAINDYKKGDKVQVKVLDMDTEKERVLLGIKQLNNDPFAESINELKKGMIVTCQITAVQDNGLEVIVGDSAPGFIRQADLAKDRNERRPERFDVGERVDAKIMSIEHSSRRVMLSIKAREIEEEKEAMQRYGSTESGASLGDILGAALKEKQEAEKKAGVKKAPKKEAELAE